MSLEIEIRNEVKEAKIHTWFNVSPFSQDDKHLERVRILRLLQKEGILVEQDNLTLRKV